MRQVGRLLRDTEMHSRLKPPPAKVNITHPLFTPLRVRPYQGQFGVWRGDTLVKVFPTFAEAGQFCRDDRC